MKLHRALLLLVVSASITADATPRAASPLVASVVECPTMFPVQSNVTGERMVPGVEIYSDGTTIIKRRGSGEIARRIDPQRIAELLTFLAAQQLFAVTEAKITEDIGKAGPLPAPTDHPDTLLFASAGDRTVTISQNAFHFFAERYPHVGTLQTMRRCIEKIYEVAGESP